MTEPDAALRQAAGWAEAIRRREEVLNRLLAAVAVSLLCFSAALAALGVALRYFAGNSYDLLEELCRIAIVYASLLYVGPLITRNAHLTMSFVTDQLSAGGKRYFDLVLYTGVTLLIGWLLMAAWRWEMSIKSMGMQTMSSAMEAWIPSAALPLGLALALFYSALRVLYRIGGVEIDATGDAE